MGVFYTVARLSQSSIIPYPSYPSLPVILKSRGILFMQTGITIVAPHHRSHVSFPVSVPERTEQTPPRRPAPRPTVCE